MIRHSLLLIFRNFTRSRGSFFINLIGLSTGLASTLLIYLWVMDEVAVDKFHESEGRLYQVMANHHNSDRIETMEATPVPLALALVREVPEILHSVNLAPASWFTSFTLAPAGSTTKFKSTGQFVDSAYLRVFSLPLVAGDKANALSDPHNILLSETLATSMFGSPQNGIGKTIDWNISQFKGQATVSGVFHDVPRTSTQQFNFLITMQAFIGLVGGTDNWGNNVPSTFVVLREKADAGQVQEKITDFLKSKLPNSQIKLFLRPYSEGYLHGRYENGLPAGGRIEYVRLFSIIAGFILVIACINFMNLSTAKASRRIKEVGIKKAVGAGRHALIIQYLGESLVMSFLSLVVALVLTQLLLPAFSQITGKVLMLEFTPSLIWALAGFCLFTGLTAGSYPAFYLSGFSPAAVLKGKVSTTGGELLARRGLVVVQFTLSAVFMVGVLVVSRQIDFVQKKDLGFDKDHVILFDKEGQIAEHAEAFISEALRVPGVTAVSSANQNLIGNDSFTIGVSWDGKNPDEVVRFGILGVDHDYVETMNLQLTSGRSFSRQMNDKSSIIINEAAAGRMGLSDPVGKRIILWGNPVEIAGVVRDFHFESFHERLKPFIFRLRPEETLHILARLESGREQEALARLEKLYHTFNPGFAFDYRFLDQDFQKLYITEQRVATLSNYFAGLAVIISCLGLFGLASFTAERRRKEVGLRKVLGSSEAAIVILLSTDLTRLVVLSLVIGLPLAYFISTYWLESFVFHVELQAWYFLGAGFTALAIAWITVGSQAFRAASVNPTECLKEQ